MAENTPGGRLPNRNILYNDEQLGPFPTHLLKHVERPTNRIVGPIERRDHRDTAFTKAFRGDYGEEIQREIRRMIRRYPIGVALTDMQDHINTIKDHRVETAPKKAPIPDDPRVRSRHLKSLGYFLGADIVGIGRLPQSAVYTHGLDGVPIEAPFKYAVVFVCRKDATTIRASNGWEQIVDPASYQSYQRVALQSEVVANYLRRLGWDAEPSNTKNYLTVMPQILLEAGIGEVCRMGIVLSPFLGTNFKASCVLTNMELLPDGPVDFGLQEYCSNCFICAEQCPSGAVSRGEQILYNGYYTWKLNIEACCHFAVRNREGTVCGRCTKVCPWTRPESLPHDFSGWDGDPGWLYEGVEARRRELVESNFVDALESTHKWWFELDEDPDGTLVVPDGVNRNKICRTHPLAKGR